MLLWLLHLFGSLKAHEKHFCLSISQKKKKNKSNMFGTRTWQI